MKRRFFQFNDASRRLLLILVLTDCGVLPAADPPRSRPLVTARRFQQSLDETVLTWSWTNQELARIVQRISEDRALSLLLDRRLDPNRELTLSITQQPVRAALVTLAEQAGGQTSVIGNSVFLGPESACRRLRTLEKLRTDELRESPSIDSQRKASLLTTTSIAWDDLATPQQILDQIAEQWGIQIAGRELVEHDLWRAAMLPSVHAAEALSLILIQFDLTFRWSGDGDSIQLIPVPDVVAIQRNYIVRRDDRRQTIETWRQAIPTAQFQSTSRGIQVTATIEEHESLERLRQGRGGAARPTDGQLGGGTLDLSRIEFTLTVADVPARAVMKRLEDSGVRFVYDANALEAAGISLDRLVEIRAEKDTADQFLKRLFGPLGLRHTISGTTVRLTPEPEPQ